MLGLKLTIIIIAWSSFCFSSRLLKYKRQKYRIILIALNSKTMCKSPKILEPNFCLLYTEYEVITAAVMKSSIFWNIMPFSPLKVNRHLLPASRWLLGWLILHPWRWKRHFPSKVRWLSTDYSASYPRKWNSLFLLFFISFQYVHYLRQNMLSSDTCFF
jgi:hypothetical protein